MATVSPQQSDRNRAARGRYLVFLWTFPLILGGCLILRFGQNWMPAGLANLWIVGSVFGTLLGQSTVAAAWATFGPAPLIWRFPLSLMWIVTLCGAWELTLIAQAVGAEGAGVVMGVCLVGYWLVVQILLWPLSLGLGIGLHFRDDTGLAPRGRYGQFSLLHLIVLTAILGCALTIGRLIWPNVLSGVNRVGEWPIYRALAWAAVVMNVPLLLGALCRRQYIAATLAALVPFVLSTIWEPTFLGLVGESALRDRQLFAVNAMTALWILVFAAVIRLNGYSLAPRGRLAQESKP